MSKRKTETGLGHDIDAMLEDSDDERAGEMIGGWSPKTRTLWAPRRV